MKVCLNFVSQTVFVYQVTESFSQPFRKIFHLRLSLITLAIWRGFKLHEAEEARKILTISPLVFQFFQEIFIDGNIHW